MAKKLTEDDLNLIFQYAEKVYNNDLVRREAVDYLKQHITAHSPFSLQMYVDNYKYLRDGKAYGRNMGGKILEYFLIKILNNFGIDALTKAINSVYFHVITYYEQTGKKQNTDILIGKKYANKYNITTKFDNIFDTNELIEQKREDEYINNVNSLIDDNVEKHYERKPKKILKKQRVYERDVKVALRALANADYCCELEKTHQSFIRKTNDKNYTEPHHLIPIFAQEKFGDNSLDIENNIVSLCSNCHNKLHYGKDIEEDLRILYENRKELLKIAGIHITFEELIKLYRQ